MNTPLEAGPDRDVLGKLAACSRSTDSVGRFGMTDVALSQLLTGNLPAMRSRLAQHIGNGWIEREDFQGRTFYRITDAGLAAL